MFDVTTTFPLMRLNTRLRFNSDLWNSLIATSWSSSLLHSNTCANAPRPSSFTTLYWLTRSLPLASVVSDAVRIVGAWSSPFASAIIVRALRRPSLRIFAGVH
jgi:hypothetical protein